MEILGGIGMGFGALLYLIGFIWLVVLGFKLGGALWGLLNFFFSPISSIVFCIMKKTGWIPLALMLVGGFFWIIGLVPLIISIMQQSGSSAPF